MTRPYRAKLILKLAQTRSKRQGAKSACAIIMTDIFNALDIINLFSAPHSSCVGCIIEFSV